MLSNVDHRRLGQELDLFHLQEEAPGAVFWHPRGLDLVRALEAHVRRAVLADGYREVRTPQMLARSIWEASGHWGSFGANMLRVEGDERDSALKPVSCPAHLQIVLRASPSYRDLPIRIAEMGVVHRKEPSGVLHGLFRLRQFTQDDGHVLCPREDVRRELVRFLRRARELYASFGIAHVSAALSTRPTVRAGSDEAWDLAEAELSRAAEAVGLPCAVQEGEGAFYGPKIELILADHAGRAWQCGTVQLDYFMPDRFGASYVGRDGARGSFAMIHRALLGSFERFAGILLEHHGGRLPPWLAPEPVRVLSVSAPWAGYAAEVASALRLAGVRAAVDARDAPLARRVRDAHEEKVSFVAVVGERDAARRHVMLRGAPSFDLPLAEAARLLAERCAAPALAGGDDDPAPAPRAEEVA